VSGSTTQLAGAALHRGPYVGLWIAGFVGEIGQWLLQIALPLLVFTTSGSAFATSVIAVLGLGSSVVFTPVVGGIADRVDPRWLLATLGAAQAVLVIGLLAVDGGSNLWAVGLVAAGEGALAGAFEAVRNAATPRFVEAGQLVAANTATGVGLSLGRLVGSPLGGLVVVIGGVSGVVLAGAVCFTAVALVAAATPTPRAAVHVSATESDQPAPATGEPPHRLRREAFRRPVLRTAAAVFVLTALAQGMFVVLILVFVTVLLRGDGADVGLLRGVQAIGGVLAGVLAGVVARRYVPSRLLVGSLAAFAVLSLLLWNGPLVTTMLWPYLVGFTLAGLPAVWMQASLLSMVQGGSPIGSLGAVTGVLLALADGFQAVGMLAAGALVEHLPVIALLNVQALLILVGAVIALRFTRDNGRHPAGRPARSYLGH
jgi:predicted MFS family arabinose efflux permease